MQICNFVNKDGDNYLFTLQRTEINLITVQKWHMDIRGGDSICTENKMIMVQVGLKVYEMKH